MPSSQFEKIIMAALKFSLLFEQNWNWSSSLSVWDCAAIQVYVVTDHVWEGMA